MAPELDERSRASIGPRGLKPFGTVEWCWQTANLLQTLACNLEANWQDVQSLLGELERAEAWTKIPPEHPYGSFEALVQAETGTRLQRIRAEIRGYEQVPELGDHGGVRSKQADNISLPSYGTSDTYAVARLKRDRPDLAERVIKGELSANAAAIEAGFRHPSATVPLDNMERLAATLRRRLDADQVAALLEHLKPGGWRHDETFPLRAPRPAGPDQRTPRGAVSPTPLER